MWSVGKIRRCLGPGDIKACPSPKVKASPFNPGFAEGTKMGWSKLERRDHAIHS
jgi:hypothetical protein